MLVNQPKPEYSSHKYVLSSLIWIIIFGCSITLGYADDKPQAQSSTLVPRQGPTQLDSWLTEFMKVAMQVPNRRA